MKKILPFFGSFLAALLLVLLFFVLLVNFCGRGVCEQSWFRELYPLKNYLARRKTGPKIIVIGGSSSLFGINGERLREYTGLDSINYSMSIMIPMRFYLADLEKTVGEGDIVVLPLELTNHYGETEEEVFSNFGISILFSGAPTNQKNLSLPELSSLYFQYGFSWINTALFHPDGPLRRCFSGNLSRQGVFDGVYKESYVGAIWEDLQKKGVRQVKNEPNHFRDLSIYGDWMIHQDPAESRLVPYQLPIALSEEFVADYHRIRDLATQRHATLLLVWPNNYAYAEQWGISEFTRLLASRGIPMIGRPEAVAFPKFFYHDPIHHMNRDGAELWTCELAKTIGAATGRPVKKQAFWPFTVFAEDPVRYFPGTASAEIYDTGVRIGAEEFPLVLPLPENLRGKKLELDLIVKPDGSENPGKPLFSKIAANGTACPVTESRYRERAEVVVTIPAACTGQETLHLQCAVNGAGIGMERAFLRLHPHNGEATQATFQPGTDAAYFAFQSGFAEPESWGRWTVAPRAEMVLRIPDRFQDQDLKLTFDVLAFVAPPQKPVSRIAVFSHGERLLQREFTDFNSRFVLSVPARFTHERQLPLTIAIEEPVSPQELGLSSDARELGIGIKSVNFAIAPDRKETASPAPGKP